MKNNCKLHAGFKIKILHRRKAKIVVKITRNHLPKYVVHISHV